MAAFVLVFWLIGAAVGVMLTTLAVRLGTQPALDELRAMRLILEDLHDQYSVDAELNPGDG